jgi:hypothetical protein
MLSRCAVALLLCMGMVLGLANSALGSSIKEGEEKSLVSNYSVTSVIAKNDVEYQEDAPELVQELEKTLSSKFAGVSFKIENTLFIIKLVEGTSKENTEAEEKARVITKNDKINAVIEFQFVKDPLAKTRAEVAAVEKELHSQIIAQKTAVRIDPENNKIMIEVASNAPVADIMQADNNSAHAAIVPVVPQALENKAADAVTETFGRKRAEEREADRASSQQAGPLTSSCQFEPKWSLCPLPVRGGVRLESSGYKEEGKEFVNVCTAGFHLRKEGIHNAILTAGHCVVGNEITLDDPWYTVIPGFKSEELGLVLLHILTNKPEVEYEKGVDAAVIGTFVSEPPETKSDVYNAGGVGSENEEFSIKENKGGVNYPGRVECKIGNHSGTQCGVVSEVDVATVVSYSIGNIEMLHTDRMCALVEAGDSGGPWVSSSHEGFDITLAGNGLSCKEKGATTGQEVSSDLSINSNWKYTL